MLMHVLSVINVVFAKRNFFRLIEFLYLDEKNVLESLSIQLSFTIFLYKGLIKKIVLQNLLSALQLDPDETKRVLAENNRKITVLQVNERSLTRQYTTLLETEQHLRKENEKLKCEIMHMETAVTEKIGNLQRFKV